MIHLRTAQVAIVGANVLPNVGVNALERALDGTSGIDVSTNTGEAG